MIILSHYLGAHVFVHLHLPLLTNGVEIYMADSLNSLHSSKLRQRWEGFTQYPIQSLWIFLSYPHLHSSKYGSTPLWTPLQQHEISVCWRFYVPTFLVFATLSSMDSGPRSTVRPSCSKGVRSTGSRKPPPPAMGSLEVWTCFCQVIAEAQLDICRLYLLHLLHLQYLLFSLHLLYSIDSIYSTYSTYSIDSI